MNFSKVIKAQNTQQVIGEFLACCQQNCFQLPNSNGSPKNSFENKKIHTKNKLKIISSMFWKNDIPSTFANKYLLQNISSFNNLKNNQQHDYSQFQGNDFIHALKLEQQEITSGISQTQTVISEYIQSAKTSVQTISDNQSQCIDLELESSVFSDHFPQQQ